MKFNDKLIQLRKEKGLSQEEFGNNLNVSRQSISKWELGQAKPDVDRIKEICEFYNVSYDYLLNDNIDEKIQLNNTKKDRKNKKINIIILIIFIIWLIYVVECSFKAIVFSRILSKNDMDNIESYKYSSREFDYNANIILDCYICYKDKMKYAYQVSNDMNIKDNVLHIAETWDNNDIVERSSYTIETEVKNGKWDSDYFYMDGHNALSGRTAFKIIYEIKNEFCITNILNPFKLYEITEDGNLVINFYGGNKYSKEIYYIDINSGYLSKYEIISNEKNIKEIIYSGYEINSVSDDDIRFDDNKKNEIIEKSAVHTYPYLSNIIINNEGWINALEIELVDESIEDEIKYLAPVRIEDTEILRDFRRKINDADIFNIEKYEAGCFWEGCPIITIYLECGEKYMMSICDQFSQNEEGLCNNVIAIWKEEDAADKFYYKIEDNLEEWFLQVLYRKV